MNLINYSGIKSFLLFLVITAFLTPSCFTQQPAEAGIEAATGKAESMSTLESDILNHINKYRQAKGLPALVTTPAIAAQAEKHSAAMASKKTAFGHDGFEDRVKIITQQLGSLRASAENVAYGKLNAQEVVDIWLKSAGHKKNIEGKYTLTGIGIATDKQGVIFFTQIFASK